MNAVTAARYEENVFTDETWAGASNETQVRSNTGSDHDNRAMLCSFIAVYLPSDLHWRCSLCRERLPLALNFR